MALSTGSSFAAKTLWYAYYGTSAGGWTSQDVYPRVVGDVDGDGDDDIVGFGAAWVYVAKSNGVDAFATRELWMDYFGHSKGWTSQNTYPRAVGDVNGDGNADVVGFGNLGTFICYSTGTTLTARVYLSTYFGKTSEGYTSQESYPRLLGDVDGDGRADVVGWKDEGVHIALSRGSTAAHDSCAPTLWLEEQANDQGWTSFNTRPRALGDANGDGRADIVGFAPDGTYVATFDRQTRFLYDGSGSRVVRIQSDSGGITRTVYAGDGYEYATDGVTSETTKFYSLGNRRVALRDSQGVSYLHPDHLGSTMVTSGAASSSQRYLPYGGQRGTAEVATDRRYTGQRWQAQFGLYDYNARWYDPELRRFVQPDAIVPEPNNPQSLNRYAYVLNNPVRYTDPSGLANERGVGGSIGDPPVARGSAIVSLLGPTIKTQAQRYGVPWQVVAGVLGAEVALDTDVWDYGESAFFLTAPPLAWTGNRAAYGALEAFLWLKPDPGPGVGNVHLSTARAVSAYYGEDPVTGLGMHELRAEWLAFQLSCPSRNVAAVAAYVGMLADYRFGSGGAPGRADHSDLATWSLTDAVAVWHGYRYGVQDVSPDGAAGYRLDRFQQRSTDMATTVNLAGGDDKIRSMYGAVPYIRQYWR